MSRHGGNHSGPSEFADLLLSWLWSDQPQIPARRLLNHALNMGLAR